LLYIPLHSGNVEFVFQGGAGRGRKLIGRKRVNLIVGWCGQFLIFVVLHQFSQVVGEWLENQILIPDWTYFYCPGTTLGKNSKRNCSTLPSKKSSSRLEGMQGIYVWPSN